MSKPDPRRFPEQLRTFNFNNSIDGKNTNILILLHGLGDKCDAFFKFGTNLKLPQTAVLALAGPFEIPFVDGKAWFEAFDESFELIQARPGEKRRATSLRKCRELVLSFLDALHAHGYAFERMHLFGFAQGGTVVLDIIQHLSNRGKLGSATAVSSCVLEEFLEGYIHDECDCTAPTPVLLLHGQKDTTIPLQSAHQTEKYLREQMKTQDVTLKVFPKAGGMISSAEEAREFMTFMARRIHQRSALEERGDLIEITSQDKQQIVSKLKQQQSP